MYYGGIDPGFTGALAIVSDEYPDFAEVFDAPVTTEAFMKGKKKTSRTIFDLSKMVEILVRYPIQLLVLENVAARPGQGVTSMFRFGHGLGLWEGMLTGLFIRYDKVLATRWKNSLGLIGTEKQAALDFARLRFPSVDLSKKKHIGRADALCLALYALQEGSKS